MEKTYYNYAKRNVEDQINWAEVGKNLTDMLKEESKIREEKKAAIDEESRKFGETLASAPTGEHAGMNQWTLDYAADAQEARLIQDRLLKSGQLKLRDYNIMRQNITDGTKGAFSLIEEYQKEYKEKMERANSMDPATRSQYLEQWYMEQAEGFGNFSRSKLYINPTNYQVSVAMKEYDKERGVYVMSENPNNFVTINDLRNRIKSKFNYFDFDKASNEWVKTLGKYTEYVDDARGWKVISDPRIRDEFNMAMDNQLKSFQAANPFNTTSLLTENIKTIDGKSFTFTFNEDEANANKNMILLRPDPNNPQGPGVPDFSTDNGKEQEKLAFDWMRQQTIAKLEHQESARYERPEKTPRQATEGEISRSKERKLSAAAARNWHNILIAKSQKEKNSARQAILGSDIAKKSDLIDIDLSSPGTIKFIFKDGALNKEFTYDPNNVNPKEWQEIGNIVTGAVDLGTADQFYSDDQLAIDQAAISGLRRKPEAKKPVVNVGNYLASGSAGRTAAELFYAIRSSMGLSREDMPFSLESNEEKKSVFIRDKNTGNLIASFNIESKNFQDANLALFKAMSDYMESKQADANAGGPDYGSK